jgi:hypothetical protein
VAGFASTRATQTQTLSTPSSPTWPQNTTSPPNWLNTNASAFLPDNATWIALDQLDGLTIQAADTETLLAMKIAAERDKDTLDIARLLRRLNITTTPPRPLTSPTTNTGTTQSPSPQNARTT